MPPKKANNRPVSAGSKVIGKPIVRNESLLATDAEKHATSKSLYGDSKARVSSNVHHIHDRYMLPAMLNAVKNGMKGKTVLHLGCGMGLLSMLSAQSLAKQVIAVDTSSIVDAAQLVATENKVENVTFLRGNIRDVVLPLEKVDVIMCEWIGCFLTNSAALKDIIFARDKYLAPGGFVCPNKGIISVVGVSDYEYYQETVEYWENVYGFKMTCMKGLVKHEAAVSTIPRNSCVTDQGLVHEVDAMTMQEGEMNFKAPFAITAKNKGTIHYLTFFIETQLKTEAAPDAARFSIQAIPGAPNPWTEVSLPLKEELPVFPGDVIKGTISVKPREKSDHCDIELEVTFSNKLVQKSYSTPYYLHW